MTYSNSSKRERDDLLQFQQLKLIDERRFEKGFEKEERKRRGGERERARDVEAQCGQLEGNNCGGAGGKQGQAEEVYGNY